MRKILNYVASLIKSFFGTPLMMIFVFFTTILTFIAVLFELITRQNADDTFLYNVHEKFLGLSASMHRWVMKDVIDERNKTE